MRYAPTGVWRPLTSAGSNRSAVGFSVSAPYVGSLSTVSPPSPQLLQALREVHGVADQRVLEALLGAEQRGGDLAGGQPDAEAERRAGPASAQRSLISACARVHRRRAAATARSAWSACGHGGAEDRHHRVADELHDRSALAEDGVVHRGAVGR